MKVALIHLSDIHINDSDAMVLKRAEKICSTINQLAPNLEAIIIVATGDIAFSGSADEYDIARKFFESIIECVKIKASPNTEVYFIPVPGNHDGEFKGSSRARNRIIDALRDTSDAIDQSEIDICLVPQNEYFKFCLNFDRKYVTFDDQLLVEHSIKIGDKLVKFFAFNMSWASTVPEVQGKVIYPISRYSDQLKEHADIKVALIHHPLNWYAQNSYHPLRTEFAKNFHLIMSGHEHCAYTATVHDEKSGGSVFFEAGALDPHGESDNSCFSVTTLDIVEERYATIQFNWDGNHYEPQNSNGTWDSFVAIPDKKSSSLSIKRDFYSQVTDVGANFTHPAKENLTLADIFVYPDAQKLSSGDSFEDGISTSCLKKINSDGMKIILRGDEHHSKTSLLNSLYVEYYNSGYLPILIKGSDFVGSNLTNSEKAITDAIAVQYGDKSVSIYMQEDNSKKVVLVDDLDKFIKRSDHLARVLHFLDSNFKNCIITTTENLDLTEISSAEASQKLKEFDSYKLHGFGYRLRASLIKKWYSLESIKRQDEQESVVHNAEKIINAVIGKGLVPTTAFNVLVLLVSIEMNNTAALANAGMAEYYEYLIRKNFLSSKLKGDSFNEMFSYLSSLAWHLFNIKAKHIDEVDLIDFNRDYSDRIHNTDFRERVEFLISSKVLTRFGDSYEFRYPYMRYFFIAKFAADNIEENPGIKDRILRSCKHLYMTENANIILFFTHHSNSKWVIVEIAKILETLLATLPRFDIVGDTRTINTFVTDAANVLIDANNIEKNNEIQNRQADHAESQIECNRSEEVSAISELDQITQLNLLFKASEILGQILKNRYGSIDKALKNDLMKQLFDAPLRGISFLTELINTNPDLLVKHLEETILEKIPGMTREVASDKSKKILFAVAGQFADALLSKQGEIIGSPKLIETINSVASEKVGSSGPERTYPLINLAAQLSYPGKIPFGLIEQLKDELKDNVFGFSILQGLIGRHIYMFSLPYNEKQKLASYAKITLSSQTANEIFNAKKDKPPTNIKTPKRPGLYSNLIRRFEMLHDVKKKS